MSKIQNFKENLFLNLFAWFKIPLIGFCSPKIIEATANRTVLKIPLGYRTRNHLNSMYFGALTIGAELCVASLAVKKIKEHTDSGGDRIDFVFKDFKADFLKRADGDVHFICDEVQMVVDQINSAKTSTERINRTMSAYAIVPSLSETEKVATFLVTLSVKRKVKK
jgi:hypothetical protein